MAITTEQVYDFIFNSANHGKYFFRREVEGEDIVLYKITLLPTGFTKDLYTVEAVEKTIQEQKDIITALESDLALIQNL